MFQQAAGKDMAVPLCCAQGLFLCSHGSQRNVDVVPSTTSVADQTNAGVSLVTGACATRGKRAVSPSDDASVGSSSSTDVGKSSILSNGSSLSGITSLGVLPTDGTHFTSCSLAAPSANITLLFSSTHGTISAPNSAQPVSTSTSLFISTPCIPQTPFTSTSTETFMTISSASPIGFTSGLSSSTAGTSATSFQSTATAIPTTVRPRPSFTMSNPDTISLATVSPTSTVIDSTSGPGTTRSVSDSTLISSLSSTLFLSSFFSPTLFSPTLLSPTFLSPIPSNSDFPTPITNPSISAISLPSSISTDAPTITPFSTLAGDQTSSTVKTGTLSTETPHNTGFAHQTGAIVGVGIAGTFVLLLIILLTFFACKRRRSNRLYNFSTEDISAVSRTTPWRPPLEADEGENESFEGVSADASGPWETFGSQPLVPPATQARHGSTNSRDPPSRLDWHSSSRPWGNTEPLNINQRDSSQQPPLTGNSHVVTAVGSRSVSSLGFGGSSSSTNGHLGSGSSGEALLPRDNRRTFVTEPKSIQRLSGWRHYSAPPAALVLGRDPSLESSTQRIQQNQQDRKSISPVILARLRASRGPSTTPTVKPYSQGTTIGSEESTPSRAPSYLYSPSLLNPPISIEGRSETRYPSRGVTGSNYTSDNAHLSLRQGARDTSTELYWPDVTLPPAPSPVPTDTSSMVEGLLHPRLGMALASSQQASAASLRDYEDYTRPINGLVNNHIKSTTTFETQNTLDLDEEKT